MEEAVGRTDLVAAAAAALACHGRPPPKRNPTNTAQTPPAPTRLSSLARSSCCGATALARGAAWRTRARTGSRRCRRGALTMGSWSAATTVRRGGGLHEVLVCMGAACMETDRMHPPLRWLCAPLARMVCCSPPHPLHANRGPPMQPPRLEVQRRGPLHAHPPVGRRQGGGHSVRQQPLVRQGLPGQGEGRRDLGVGGRWQP